MVVLDVVCLQTCCIPAFAGGKPTYDVRLLTACHSDRHGGLNYLPHIFVLSQSLGSNQPTYSPQVAQIGYSGNWLNFGLVSASSYQSDNSDASLCKSD